MKKLLLLLTLIFGTHAAMFAQVPVYVTNTSSPAACDGYAYLDSSVVITNISWMGNGAILQTGGTYIGNLCAGTYIVSYNTSNGTSMTSTFTIGSGSGNPCSTLQLDVTVTYASSASSCDGGVSLIAYGGTAPYTYTWNNAMGGGLMNNLCVGSYYVCVTDQNGCVSCDSVIVLDSSAVDSVLIFSNNPFPNGTVSGVLVTTSVEDCTLDYQNVGSATVTATTPLSIDSVLVTWTLYDTTGMVAATYNVVYFVPAPNVGIFNLSLIVYCSQKSTNYNTIQVNDQILIEQNNIVESLNTAFKVVNPLNDELKLYIPETGSYQLTICNLEGKRVFEHFVTSQGWISFPVQHLEKGMYLLTVFDGSKNAVSAKVIR
jgi:hypothetical protein